MDMDTEIANSTEVPVKKYVRIAFGVDEYWWSSKPRPR